MNPIEKVLAVSSSCGDVGFGLHPFGATGVFVHPIMKSGSARSAEARRQVVTYQRIHLAFRNETNEKQRQNDGGKDKTDDVAPDDQP